MSRLVVVAALLLASSSLRAEEVAPEKLLSPSTQIYVRWDGITPHKAAYKGSAWGGVMSGPTGKNLIALLDKLPEFLGPEMLGTPLLDGQPLEELRKVQTDLKLVGKLPDLIADHGAMIVLEVREPKPTAAGLIKAVGGAIQGDPKKGNLADSFMPDVRFFLIVPNVGDKAEALFAPTRLFNRSSASLVAKPLDAGLKVTGFFWPDLQSSGVQMAEWVMDGHYVEYIGTAAPSDVINTMRTNSKNGGITNLPLYKRAAGLKGFESVARGFVDVGAALGLTKKLAGPLIPGLAERLDDTGIGCVSSIVFSTGFDGKESRATWEIDTAGERKGLAKILKNAPVSLKDLPPLPADCSRFSALRVDWAAVFDAGINTTEALLFEEQFGVEGDKASVAELIKVRRDFLRTELDKATGISVKEDLIPHLGDLFVMYQSPCEGLQVFGQCVAISCKDPTAVRNAVDRMQRAVSAGIGNQTKVRKKMYEGVEMREIYSREFGFVVPCYAVVGDWLIMGGNPQLIQGFILRHKGQIESWKPDPGTAERIAKFPKGNLGIQYCNPNSTAQNMCCVGPLFLGAFSAFSFGRDTFDPIDVGIVPNAHELGKHLFSNLAATYDDGKTIRVEVNESLSLPMDFIGFDPFLFAIFTAAARF